jgi:general L-amino acid transport system permease protein
VLFRRVLGQLLFIVLLGLAAREAYLNLEFNAAAQSQDLSFDFLNIQAGFNISEGIEYESTDPVSRAFVVGFVNTLKVAGLGIVLASLLGLVIGVARLSPNWLVRKLSQGYVDLIRNTPVAVQILFWWAAVFLAAPRIEDSVSLFDVAYLSNKGAEIPWFHLEPGGGALGGFLLAGLLGGFALSRWRKRVHETTGRPARGALWALGGSLGVVVAGYLVTGTPTAANIPELSPTGFSYEGGIHFTPEFGALLVGLVIYTAAFIAEVIRGSIQAVQKGQREAAEALGLSRVQQLRFVILPQALRIAIPAINSQYLNLMKNSSLGVLIGFFELTRVSKSIISGRGHNVQVLFLLMATYLAISLFISTLMNVVNRSVTRKGARL